MEVLSDFDIRINKDNVLRYMGYKKGQDISPLIEGEIEKQITLAGSLIQPALVYDEYLINIAEDEQKVFLSNGLTWEDEFIAFYLKGCNAIIVLVATVGLKISNEIEAFFAGGEYLKAMILDSIANDAIDSVSRQFWLKLVNQAKRKHMGITGLLSPGHGDWDVKQQKSLFRLVDASAIGVELTDSCLMIPMKSISGMYGVGKGIPVSKSSHNCEICHLKNCFMREVD